MAQNTRQQSGRVQDLRANNDAHKRTFCQRASVKSSIDGRPWMSMRARCQRWHITHTARGNMKWNSNVYRPPKRPANFRVIARCQLAKFSLQSCNYPRLDRSPHLPITQPAGELWQPLPRFRNHSLRIRSVFRSPFFVTKFNCFLLFLTARPIVTLFLLLLLPPHLATCQCTRTHTAARSCSCIAAAVAYSQALKVATLNWGFTVLARRQTRQSNPKQISLGSLYCGLKICFQLNINKLGNKNKCIY